MRTEADVSLNREQYLTVPVGLRAALHQPPAVTNEFHGGFLDIIDGLRRHPACSDCDSRLGT